MKTIPNRTIYRCDYCTTHRLSANAAQRHEQFCRSNPANQHACFGCQHLLVSDSKDVAGNSIKLFVCQKLDKGLYSYKAEKRGLVRPGVIDPRADRMPLDCDYFQYADTDPAAPFALPATAPAPFAKQPESQDLPF